MEANHNNDCLVFCLIFAFVSLSSASSLFRDLIGEVDVCEDVCQKTYPPHTYDKSLSEDCCKRGCRLYSIIELIGEEDGVNGTLKACYDNCNDAYPGLQEETAACIAGCNSQKPFTDKFGSLPGLKSFMDPREDSLAGMMSPFLYMHDIYSNVVDKVSQQMSVSWSFFMQDGNGRLVVIKSQPQVIEVDDLTDSFPYRATSMAAETNLEPLARTATEMLRHSQLKSAKGFANEINVAETEPWKMQLDNESEPPTDWLTCIANKTGIPRLFLCVLILLSAVSMIWLCMSAAVGAPEHKSAHQLSIRAMDMDYLRHLPEKKGIKGFNPQDVIEARPLPVKIRIEKI